MLHDIHPDTDTCQPQVLTMSSSKAIWTTTTSGSWKQGREKMLEERLPKTKREVCLLVVFQQQWHRNQNMSLQNANCSISNKVTRTVQIFWNGDLCKSYEQSIFYLKNRISIQFKTAATAKNHDNFTNMVLKSGVVETDSHQSRFPVNKKSHEQLKKCFNFQNFQWIFSGWTYQHLELIKSKMAATAIFN